MSDFLVLRIFLVFSLVLAGSILSDSPASSESDPSTTIEEATPPPPSPSKSKEKPLTEEQLNKKIDILSKTLKFGTTTERKMALQELTKIPEDKQSSFIPQATLIADQETDATLRIHAVRALTVITKTLSEELITKIMEDKNQDLSREIMQFCRKHKTKECKSPLKSTLNSIDFSSNSNQINAVISTLSDVDTENENAEFLLTKLKDESTDSEIKTQIVLYMGARKVTSSIPTLEEIFENEDKSTYLRSYSINSLGKIPSPGSSPKLKSLLISLKDPSSKMETKKKQTLKMYTLQALATLGDKDIIKELIDFAKDDDSGVRLKSIELMSTFQTPEIKELLEFKSVRDPSPRVQKAAKKALEAYSKPQEATPPSNP
jgi:hypothetical protein